MPNYDIINNQIKILNGSGFLLIFSIGTIQTLLLTSITSDQPSHCQYSDDSSSCQSWSVLDWWQENIKEDLYDVYKSSRNIINKAPMGRFVQIIKPEENNYSLQENDLEPSESDPQPERIKRPEEPIRNKTINSSGKEKKRPLYFSSSNSDELIQHSELNHSKSEQEDQNYQPFIPKSSLSSIKSLFYEYFTNIRSNLFDPHIYINLKRNLRTKFLEYGLQTAIQGFYHNKRNDKGHNIVGIYPSIYRNTSKQLEDSVLVIGAHYDTVARSPGVEDNGSGSVAVLELARLLHKHRCKLNTSIIFVLFDMEEDGLIGSKHFVRNYLIPVEIEKNQIPVKGAVIIDMLLEYDTTVNSQMTQGIGNILPDWNDRVRQNRFRADFIAVWARKNIDSELYRTLQSNWLNRQKYKLFLMDPPLPKSGRQLTSGLATKKLRPYSTFLRSDHSSFWYPHSLKNETINAILLTDLGPWRRKVANKYHSSADNSKLLSRANLLFLKNAIDSIMKTVLNMSNGFCQESWR